MLFLAVIPARSGSKGVPGKNKKLLNGIPLIQYTINAAVKSKSITDIIITTDDEDIINIARNNKIDSIKRCSNLSEDKTPMLPVIIDVINKYEKKYFVTVDYIVLLQPTCPARNFKYIDESIDIFSKNDSDSLVSVFEVGDNHPGRMYSIENGYMDPFMPELITKNRQDLPKLYLRNGAIYILKRDNILNNNLYGEKVIPYIMSKEDSVNIDDPIDFEIANYLFSK